MTAGKNRVVKYGVYSLELLVLFVLQVTPGLSLPIFGEKPILVLAALLTFSLLEDEVPALFLGLGGGLLLDFGAGGPTGINAILCCIICCGISVWVKGKIHVTMLSAMTTGAVALGVYTLLQWLLCYMAWGYSQPFFALINHFLPRYVYTLLLIPLLYLGNLGLYMGFRFPEQS